MPSGYIEIDTNDIESHKGECQMKTLIKTLAAVAASTALTTAFAQSAKEVRGSSPYVEIKNEPPPRLIVDPPLPEGAGLGRFLGPVPS
jgi:Family of unknown function (DUF6130)